MPVANNYAIIMLDLNSPSIEIKLSALEEISKLEHINPFVRVLKKLSKHKNQQVKDKAIFLLNKAGLSKESSEPGCISSDADLTDILQLLEMNATTEFLEVFKPYLKTNTDNDIKSAHVPLDIKERIQKLIIAQEPINKVIGMCLLLLIPLEFKYTVTALVDLLRDKSNVVVAITIQHLIYFDKEVVKKVIPILIDKFKEDHNQTKENLEEFLRLLDDNLFNDELEQIKNDGLTMKTSKLLTDKLYKCLQ